jgi:hypothetical protein
MKTGELLVISFGEYSDYTFNIVCRCLKDFDPIELVKEFISKNRDQLENYSADFDSFVAYALKQGYIVEDSWKELHLGCYGDFKPEVADRKWGDNNYVEP